LDKRNRNILIGVLAAALLLCCCCAIWSGTLIALLWPSLTSSHQDGGQVEVITTEPIFPEEGLDTPAAEPVTPQPTAEAESTASPEMAATPFAESAGTPAARATQLSTAEPQVMATGSLTSTESTIGQAQMPPADEIALAERLRPGVMDVPPTVNPTPPSYKVGDQLRFWVESTDTQETRQITATLQYMTPHVYVWVENGLQLNSGYLKSSADRFESKTYPTDREFFGSEWTPGVDNDVHLSLLHATGLGKHAAAYFSSVDEFSHLVNKYSNEKEMFYIAGDKESAEPDESYYDGVLAHEFQHMIHWHLDPQEVSWLNEGMSELAAHLNGYDTGGFEYAYAQNTDTQLTTWTDLNEEDNSSHYGASYLFVDYFLDRFGEQLTRAVVASKSQGVESFDKALAEAGRPERFNDIFADWLVANYLNMPEANPKGRFGYSDITPPSPDLAEVYRRFPASANAEVSQYAADYLGLQGRGDLTVDFQGQTTVGLVAGQPRGHYSWYSNRGDSSDATLTRTFDLRGVSSATLTFSAWYDIEDGWDYAYIEASTDGGKHWQILRGRQSSDDDKSGNAYGPGWTGMSGGGKVPQWVSERVDLTPYAGKEVQLRFEYVTDAAVNRPGLLLDNLAISELNYSDGGENGIGGWQAAGWVLTDNTLTQHWLVQLVAANGNNVTVQRMAVGPDGKGELALTNAGQYDKLVLIVSALAPVTTEPAAYSYNITSR
jgi:immune inhibitor A